MARDLGRATPIGVERRGGLLDAGEWMPQASWGWKAMMGEGNDGNRTTWRRMEEERMEHGAWTGALDWSMERGRSADECGC